MPQYLRCTEELPRHAMRKCYVANLSALVGCDLFPRPLSDLAVACAVACQTDHTDRRRYPRSGLLVPASIIVAFLVLPNSTRRFGITYEVIAFRHQRTRGE